MAKTTSSTKSINSYERNSSIELLRIILMIGVVILHYNNHNIGGGFNLVNPNSVNLKYMLIINTLFAIAVDTFVIISGYYLSMTNKRRVSKVIELLTIVILCDATRYFLYAYRINHFSIKEFINIIIPNNYFIILYSVLYLVSPYINIVLKKLNKVELKEFIVLMFVLFSIYPFVVDALGLIKMDTEGLSSIGLSGSGAGYTIVNFVLLYILGAYINISKLKTSNKKASIIIVLMYIIQLAITLIENKVKGSFGSAWTYHNPFLIIMSIYVFILFSNYKFYNRYINELAGAVFICYVIHMFLLRFLHIDRHVNGTLIRLIINHFLGAIAIYLISYVVYKIYNLIRFNLWRDYDRE